MPKVDIQNWSFEPNLTTMSKNEAILVTMIFLLASKQALLSTFQTKILRSKSALSRFYSYISFLCKKHVQWRYLPPRKSSLICGLDLSRVSGVSRSCIVGYRFSKLHLITSKIKQSFEVVNSQAISSHFETLPYWNINKSFWISIEGK